MPTISIYTKDLDYMKYTTLTKEQKREINSKLQQHLKDELKNVSAQ